ncbi:cell division and transport-associated protein TolA [Yoonia maricola]|uniref:Cell division and transport-associated protein TolA n=1 Tax=Yoonia maricola TaxID=420999 RepID=A0A2M8WPC7_9RHOB|nr:energy transducer TonB [Yoonia maricola]PJI92792.1 cell division and transport-associated protein TolA [Yoonia maricola]
MASPGTIISGIGHVGLIGWLIVGWGLTSEPLEIQTMDVSVVSGEEFEQMRARTTPDPGDADPTAPVPPVVDETPPPPPAEEEPTETAPPPDPVEPPEAETPPPPPPPAPPETEVTDAPPVEPAPPVATPPTPDVDVSDAPTPPQAQTVTSTITTPPPPDANVHDIVRDEIVEDNSAEPEVVQEEQEATAPEETTTAIVIEDEAPSAPVSLAPATSARPSARPSLPTPPVETASAAEEPASEEQVAAEPEPSEDDVAAALEAALSAKPDAPAVAAGPPMTGAERDSFRLAVNGCWNVDPGSVAARVTVEVGFSLDREGKVRGNEVRLISSDGDQGATNTAFEAARRAILRCQSGGYQLPADKYDQWQDVVITFDPSGMRLR